MKLRDLAGCTIVNIEKQTNGTLILILSQMNADKTFKIQIQGQYNDRLEEVDLEIKQILSKQVTKVEEYTEEID